jgi:hypothetical protein
LRSQRAKSGSVVYLAEIRQARALSAASNRSRFAALPGASMPSLEHAPPQMPRQKLRG